MIRWSRLGLGFGLGLMLYNLQPSLVMAAQLDPASMRPPARTAVAATVDAADAAAARRGGRTELMVLGTAHLTEHPALATADRLVPLIDRLVAFAPRLVMIEAMPGAHCDALRAEGAPPATLQGICPDTSVARAVLGVDGPGARRAITRLLDEPDAARPPGERRRLAALFLASGEPASALLHWLRLPVAERRADAALTPPLVDRLQRLARSANENYRIAVPVALRLGHLRVIPVDAHVGEDATGPFGDADNETLRAIWTNPASAERQTAQARWVADVTVGRADMLSWYRWLNGIEAARLAIANDFGAAAGDASQRMVGRRYLAYWEARNLAMAANVRTVLGPAPGGRALAIVGASHKPYYERYLGVSSDIVFAPVDAVLAA